jgi:UDPglucose 6-dehydrogenase
MNVLRLGIVGNGFVGSAVSNGFDVDTEQFIVDPKQNDNTMEQLMEFDPKLVFVCVPTPPQDTHYDVDVQIVDSVLKDLEAYTYKGIVVIKSTITPDHLTRFKKKYNLSLVYNPEFLTEANAFEDFLNPSMQILGGKWKDCENVEKAYVKHSSVKTVPTFKTDIITASLIKYTINSWLATKVSFFNELHELFEASGTKVPWESFTEMLSQDKRMGDTHMKVPGTDGLKGFGGHCFPKDTKALVYYAKLKKSDLSILKKAIDKNDKIRTK